MDGLGFWDFLKPSSKPPVAVFEPQVQYLGGPAWEEWVRDQIAGVASMSAAEMWRSQPHLRTVVSFLARNVAHLGLHVFERVSDTDRRRDTSSPLAVALLAPDAGMTAYDLIYALVGDKALYDRAYWLIGTDNTGRYRIRRLPPTWVTPVPGNPFEVGGYRAWDGSKTVDLPADRVLEFPGYSPSSPQGCSPTIESLRETLQEQLEAAKYRVQVWARGGRVSAVISRPKEAGQWSPEAREAFREDWYDKYTGNGSKAGGTPILEDGMTLQKIDFSAADQQFVEASKLSFSTIAAAFHVNPTMVGVLDNANYSNVREFRRMLYGDTLGPLLAEIESRINAFLLPKLGMDNTRYYAEFNIAEKLQGSFEEQAAVMSTMVGAPLMTRDEGRARFNLPAMGGDAEQLVTPLNVLVGGQASPRDSGTQNQNSGRVLTKGAPSDPQREKAEQIMRGFFTRQEKAIRSLLGAKSSDWWDEDRWNSELGDDLFALAVLVSEQIGRDTAVKLGFDPQDYDTDRTLNFLKEVAARRAESINAATRIQIEDALASDDPGAAVDSVWTTAQEQRSGAAAAAVLALAAGFGTTEAARQVSGGQASKTWVTGTNPRPKHQRINGETVGIDEPFSNGLQWPGESGDVDEVAGCNCSVEVNV